MAKQLSNTEITYLIQQLKAPRVVSNIGDFKTKKADHPKGKNVGDLEFFGVLLEDYAAGQITAIEVWLDRMRASVGLPPVGQSAMSETEPVKEEKKAK